MKKFNFLIAGMVLASSFSAVAQADSIIDTGVPTGGVVNSNVLDGGDWLAAEFTTTQDWTINSIQGNIAAIDDSIQSGNSFTISIYDSNPSNISVAPNPGTTYQEFTGQATFTSDGWNGLSGLNNLTLAAGTYWVAFEVSGSNSFSGYMASGTSTPLTTSAWYDSTSTSGYKTQASNLDLGVQISGVAAVPVPASVWLFGSALLGLFGVRKSKQA